MTLSSRLLQGFSSPKIVLCPQLIRTKLGKSFPWHQQKFNFSHDPLPQQCRFRHENVFQSVPRLHSQTRQYLPRNIRSHSGLATVKSHSNPLGHLLWRRSVLIFASCQRIQSSFYSVSVDGTFKAKVRGIQKDVSPLTTKRVLRRKKTKDSTTTDKIVFDVVAFATSEEIDLETLQHDLHRQGLYSLVNLPKDVEDAIHVEANYKVDDEMREMFFFREGSVIFWNVPEVERNSVMTLLRRHQTDSYDSLLINENFERVDFTFIDSTSTLDGDEIQLQRNVPKEEGQSQQLEKYAFSNGLALSVKLSIWEASLERYVDSIEWILQDLKEGKKIRMSRAEVLRKTGELFTLRHLINLSSDLLDTPDFYWDREVLEQLYTKACTHLSISRRTKVMNEKLTHCCELAELVREHLNDKHHTRLEWMIIILIMIEVLFEIVHIVERYM